MARGVSENFLAIAERERRLGQRTALLAAALALPAGFLAELADAPGYGPLWMLFVGALLAGLALGALRARRRLHRWEEGLRTRWNHWMRGAVDAQRMADVERRVARQDPLPPLLGEAAGLALVAANLALFALLWAAHAATVLLAPLLIVLDGAVLGALAAEALLQARWARDLVAATRDLMRHGELPVWGVR